MTDRNGNILYTSNTTYIGKNVFGNEFQASLRADIRDSSNSFMRDSLSGSAGSGYIRYRGKISTIAYQPVSSSAEQFGVVYIVASHEFQETVGPLIDQQRNFNLIIIGLIAAIAVGTACLVLTWNKRLSAMVKSRTAELEEANEPLQDAVEQLKVHDRMQREFINVAAHELRTPTQDIIGYSELFYIRPESRDEAMKVIARNSERLDRLTSAILDVTRIEGQKLTLNREKFNLSEVLSCTVEDAKSTIDDSNVKFEHSTPGNIVVEADRGRISQVISKLLDNAVKFTKRGAIYISEETKDGQAVVSIKDTGTGIDPEIMSMLFTKFTTKSQTGTGLGLFIAKSIIEAHGGRIWAENNEDGKGATFIFRVPLQT
jgi:signal transduction histidine kinase